MELLKYLGEIDCFEDLADIVGQQKAEESFRGKLNYFVELNSEEKKVFGVGDYAAEYIFSENDVV